MSLYELRIGSNRGMSNYVMYLCGIEPLEIELDSLVVNVRERTNETRSRAFAKLI